LSLLVKTIGIVLVACMATSACPADVMLVFGDVGELRKVAESADDLNVLTMREAIQYCFELVPCGLIFFAVEADRGLADVLNDREDRLAFLAAHRIAKNAAEKTDIVMQRQILVRSFEQIHDHTNSNYAAAEAASNSTTAIGLGSRAEVVSKHPWQIAAALALASAACALSITQKAWWRAST
jgi:hypothetical protein